MAASAVIAAVSCSSACAKAVLAVAPALVRLVALGHRDGSFPLPLQRVHLCGLPLVKILPLPPHSPHGPPGFGFGGGVGGLGITATVSLAEPGTQDSGWRRAEQRGCASEPR